MRSSNPPLGDSLLRPLVRGLTVDAFTSSRSDLRQYTCLIEGKLEDNSLTGNRRNTSLFSFTNSGASIGLNPRADWKYLQESAFEIADLDGELE